MATKSDPKNDAPVSEDTQPTSPEDTVAGDPARSPAERETTEGGDEVVKQDYVLTKVGGRLTKEEAEAQGLDVDKLQQVHLASNSAFTVEYDDEGRVGVSLAGSVGPADLSFGAANLDKLTALLGEIPSAEAPA